MLGHRAQTSGLLWIHNQDVGPKTNALFPSSNSHFSNGVFPSMTNRHRNNSSTDRNREPERNAAKTDIQRQRKHKQEATNTMSSISILDESKQSYKKEVTTDGHKSTIEAMDQSKGSNHNRRSPQSKERKVAKHVPPVSKHSLRPSVFADKTNRNRENPQGKTIPFKDANKRKAELERLKKRSLTKNNSTRLRHAESPVDLLPKDFRDRQQKSVEHQKVKVREARTYLNTSRADGNEFNVSEFTKQQRDTVQKEKANLHEAKVYLSKYQSDGKTKNNFSMPSQTSAPIKMDKPREVECKDQTKQSAESKSETKSMAVLSNDSTLPKELVEPIDEPRAEKEVEDKLVGQIKDLSTTSKAVPNNSLRTADNKVEEKNLESVDSAQPLDAALTKPEMSVQIDDIEDIDTSVTTNSDTSEEGDDELPSLCNGNIEETKYDPYYGDELTRSGKRADDETCLNNEECFACAIM